MDEFPKDVRYGFAVDSVSELENLWMDAVENKPKPQTEDNNPEPRIEESKPNKMEVLKCRIKLYFNYVKSGILFMLCYLWIFSPGFLVLLIPEGLKILGWLCLIGVYFNIHLASGKNFLMNKWFDALETERKEIRP